jgi:competence ComEA-like helix-hairpin-helix protein
VRTAHHLIVVAALLALLVRGLDNDLRQPVDDDFQPESCAVLSRESPLTLLSCRARAGDGSSLLENEGQDIVYTFGQPMDLNRARSEDLMLIPGIGPKRAKAILDLRKTKGAFRELAELEEVRGIGPKTVEKLESSLRCGAPRPRPAGRPVGANSNGG